MPRNTAPASFNLRTTSASSVGTRSLNKPLAAVVRVPAVSMLSFSAIGIPCSGPRHFPCRCSASIARAVASAAFTRDGDIRIQRGIVLFDASEARARELDRRCRFAAQEFRCLLQRESSQLSRGCERGRQSEARCCSRGGLKEGSAAQRGRLHSFCTRGWDARKYIRTLGSAHWSSEVSPRSTERTGRPGGH